MENSKKNIPAIRFKGFTEEWDEKELGEIALFNPKADLPEKFEYVDLESVVGTMMVSHREEKKGTAPSRAQRLAKHGDLFYQTVRPYQRNNYLFEKSSNNYVFSTGYAQMRPYGNGCFLLTLVQIEAFIKQVLNNCTGTSYPAISSTDLSKIKIFNSKPAEQQQIGNFFRNIDKLIEANQTKLEKLNNIKKACLEKMFPKKGATTPEIRFKGFTGEWRTKYLHEDEFEIIAGGDIDKNKLNIQGNYPVFANALVNDGIVGYYLNEYRISAPAVTVTGRGDVGHAQARKINFTPVVRLLAIKSPHDVNYMENAINMHEVFVESTGVPQLTVPQIEKYEIWFPINDTEEKRIGLFFSKLDKLIELQRQQLTKLKNIKKACLEKMFVNKEDAQ